MKIAFLYAPSEQQFIPVPPLGIATLASEAKKRLNHEIDTIDLELELWLDQGGQSSIYASSSIVPSSELKDINFDSLLERLAKYDVLCFSIMGKRQIPYACRIVELLRKTACRQVIIFGGIFFNENNIISVAQKSRIDGFIIGEGWNIIGDALRYFIGEKYDPTCIHIQEEKAWKVIKARSKSQDLLPVADYSTINLEGYIKQQKEIYRINNSEITYQLLVGDRCCPYNCNFCRIRRNTDRIKSAKEIAREMVFLQEKYNCKNFSLICNEMNPSESFINEFADELLASNVDLNWYCYLRPGQLSNNTIKKIAKAGCKLVRFGVESGSQRVLDLMNKETNVLEIQRIIRETHKNNIWTHINIMTGYPYETGEDVENTIDFLKENATYIDSVRVNPFFLPAGSPLHKEPERFSIKIIEETNSFIKFEQNNMSWEEKIEQIKKSTDLVLDVCSKLQLSYAGIIPNLLLTALVHFKHIDQTKKWVKSVHPYLSTPVSPDTAKWLLAHPGQVDVEINPWESIAGQRGENYALE